MLSLVDLDGLESVHTSICATFRSTSEALCAPVLPIMHSGYNFNDARSPSRLSHSTHTHTHTWKCGRWCLLESRRMRVCGESCERAVLSTITHIPCTVCTTVTVSVSISFLMYMILLTALRYKMPICSASGTQRWFPVWFVSVSLFCSPEQCCSFYILDQKGIDTRSEGGAQCVQDAHVIICLYWICTVCTFQLFKIVSRCLEGTL